MIRLACFTTKGGVGASTIAQQILAPYLLSRTGSSALFEIGSDTESHAGWMNKSRIDRKVFTDNRIDGHDFGEMLLDVFYDEPITSFALDALEVSRADIIKAASSMFLLRRFDLILIPVSESGEIDRALYTFKLIEECEPEALRRVAFCLNRFPESMVSAKTTEDLEEEVADIRNHHRYFDLKKCVDLVARTGSGFVVIPEFSLLKKARETGLTLHELAEQSFFLEPSSITSRNAHINLEAANLKSPLEAIYKRIDELILKARRVDGVTA